MSFKLLTKQNSEFLCLKGSYTFKTQCWKSHVEVHMYVLQYMHVYTVNIDDTLYLQPVPLKLNISTCYWCSFPKNKYFGPKHALQSSDSSAATEFRFKSHFYSTLSNAAHCMRPGTQATNVELINVDAVSKLIWYRFIGNRVRDIFLVYTNMVYPCFQQQSHEFRSHKIHAISL